MYFNSREIYQKVYAICLQKGWSLYHLAEMAEISVNTLYSWRDRGSSPTLYLIENIARAYKINPISLLLKDEEITAMNKEYNELLTRWNSLSDEQKTSLMSMLRSFTDNKD